MGAPITIQLSKTVEGHGIMLQEHATKLNEHEFILNGVKDCPGLVSDVHDMKDMMKTMEKLWVTQNVWNKILGIVALPLVTSIVVLIWSMIIGKVTLFGV
jgi:hypothetical protein